MRKRFYSLLMTVMLSMLVSMPASAADCSKEFAVNYCSCLMYPSWPSVGTPGTAILAPLFQCLTDIGTADYTLPDSTVAKYPRGILPHFTYKVLKDSDMARMFKKFVASMMSIAILFHGYKAMLGMGGDLKKTTFTLLLKAAGVYYFIDNAGDFYLQLLGVMYEFADIAASTAASLGSSTFWSTCYVSDATTVPPTTAAPNTTLALWSMWDCILNYLLGLKGNTKDIVIEWLGIISFTIFLMATLSSGFLIGLLLLYFIASMLLSIVRFIQAFVMCVFALSFMFFIGFIFVPLILFRGTYQYFERWLSTAFSYILMPGLLIGFMCMCLVMLDTVLFSGDNSLFTNIESLTNVKKDTSSSSAATDYSNLPYTDDNSLNPIFQAVTNTQNSFMAPAQTSYSNDSAASCSNIHVNSGFLGSTQQSPTQKGSAAENTMPATSGRFGFDFKGLHLTKCVSTTYAAQSPPGCTNDPGKPNGEGLADKAGDSGLNSWKYISKLLRSAAVAAVLAYIMASILAYIPQLVNSITNMNDTSSVTGGVGGALLGVPGFGAGANAAKNAIGGGMKNLTEGLNSTFKGMGGG